VLRTAKEPPFTILVDTREQREFRFYGLATTVGTLKTGDYSLVGYQDRVAVERKSKADIWMCCATERPRFERCLERLAALERAAVVIECDLRELSIRPEYIQRVTPATVVGSCISWSCKYRLPFYWCDTRAYAERVTVRFLAAFLKHVANSEQPSTNSGLDPLKVALANQEASIYPERMEDIRKKLLNGTY
jgi:DNA excision repair protein ERCC-4